MYEEVSKWSDSNRKINVRTNADTPADSLAARAFGAEGIGLCRTEHMFFEGDRIWAIREFILADDEVARKAALAKLLQGLAKKVEGKEKGMSGPASGLVGAIVHSVRVMGRRHSAKLTMKEIIAALQKKKQAKKPKVSLSQVLDAFRLPPRVPKKKKDPSTRG